MKVNKGVTDDTELNADDLKALSELFKKEYKDSRRRFPSDPPSSWGY